MGSLLIAAALAPQSVAAQAPCALACSGDPSACARLTELEVSADRCEDVQVVAEQREGSILLVFEASFQREQLFDSIELALPWVESWVAQDLAMETSALRIEPATEISLVDESGLTLFFSLGVRGEVLDNGIVGLGGGLRIGAHTRRWWWVALHGGIGSAVAGGNRAIGELYGAFGYRASFGDSFEGRVGLITGAGFLGKTRGDRFQASFHIGATGELFYALGEKFLLMGALDLFVEIRRNANVAGALNLGFQIRWDVA